MSERKKTYICLPVKVKSELSLYQPQRIESDKENYNFLKKVLSAQFQFNFLRLGSGRGDSDVSCLVFTSLYYAGRKRIYLNNPADSLG